MRFSKKKVSTEHAIKFILVFLKTRSNERKLFFFFAAELYVFKVFFEARVSWCVAFLSYEIGV